MNNIQELKQFADDMLRNNAGKDSDTQMLCKLIAEIDMMSAKPEQHSSMSLPPEFICKNMFKPWQRHIAIDIETLSAAKDAATFAIGYAVFSAEEGILTSNNLLLSMEEALQLGVKDASTTNWWNGMLDRFVMQCNGKMKVTEAMSYLQQVFASYNITHAWGNGPDFDMVIIDDKCAKTGSKVPWKYWNVQSIRTIKASFGEPVRKDNNRTHIAQYDAEYEAEVAIHGLQILLGYKKFINGQPVITIPDKTI